MTVRCNLMRFTTISSELLTSSRTAQQEAVHGPSKVVSVCSHGRKTSIAALKDMLSNPAVFLLPQGTGHYNVDTDTCDENIGCVPPEKQPDRPEKQLYIGH